MNSLKEIFQALNSRIKTPIFGSIVISFITINWKPLFFICFANENVLVKFEFFDTHTSGFSLLFFPLILGVTLAVAAPWSKLLSAYIAIKPTQMLQKLQNNSAHEILIYKEKLELARKKLLEASEVSLIEQAMRDEEIKQEIDNEHIREKLQNEIRGLRETSKGKTNDQSHDKLSTAQKEQVSVLKRKVERLEKHLVSTIFNEIERGDMEDEILYLWQKIGNIQQADFTPRDPDGNPFN